MAASSELVKKIHATDDNDVASLIEATPFADFDCLFSSDCKRL